jgi:hypothetical protein
MMVLRNNNCYHDANDLVNNTFAQPGLGCAISAPGPPDCAGTGYAASRDGQWRIPHSHGPYTAFCGYFHCILQGWASDRRTPASRNFVFSH